MYDHARPPGLPFLPRPFTLPFDNNRETAYLRSAEARAPSAWSLYVKMHAMARGTGDIAKANGWGGGTRPKGMHTQKSLAAPQRGMESARRDRG